MVFKRKIRITQNSNAVDTFLLQKSRNLLANFIIKKHYNTHVI